MQCNANVSCYLYLSPGRLKALGPHRLVCQVEAELEDVGL